MPYPVNSANSVIGGGGDSGVYVAPLGTTAPIGLAAPAAAFKPLGWLSAEGIDDELKYKLDNFRGHQGGGVVRSIYSDRERTFSFQCLEHTAVTVGLRNPGTTYAVATGVATGVQKQSSTPSRQMFVIDEYDVEAPVGSAPWLMDRWIIPSGTIDPSGKSSYKVDGLTVLEFVLTPNSDVTHTTNRPGVVAP